MKKNPISPITATLLLSLFIAGSTFNCLSINKENKITFDTISINESYHLFDNDKKPSCEINIEFVYPKEYKDQKILKSIQSIFYNSLFGETAANHSANEIIREHIKGYIAEYKNLEEDYPSIRESLDLKEGEEPYSLSYMENLSTQINFNEKDILVFSSTHWEYTGGAHGYGAQQSYIIDLSSGNLVKEDNIYEKDKKDEITRLIINQLMEDYEVTTIQGLGEAGFFSPEEIAPNSNLLADNQGITYRYNQYEIAPYSMGVIEVLIPYEKIGKYIRKDCPLTRLLKDK